MTLKLDAFAEPVRGVLQKYSAHMIPLTKTGSCNRYDAEGIQSASPSLLFPGAPGAEAAVSGLLLLIGCWDESHKLSQDIASREGSYWHAIAHRIEPDSSNSAYWFRRVGEHPIFAELHRRASEILERRNARWKLKPAWDPFLFLEWCGEARQAPGSDEEQAALQIQRAEWDLLFEWCAVEPH
jgi:hypothetical protein